MRYRRNPASLVAAAFCALAAGALTACGGDDNQGAAPQTQVIHSFGKETPPVVSPSALVLGNDGNFYAIAQGGGANNGGFVFKITPTGVVSVLYSFGPPLGASNGDGNLPSGLIQGSDGNFYGTTFGGGANNAGAVFKMTPDGIESVLYSFKGYPSDSAGPTSGLFQASDGNFYGTTGFGGADNKGTVFEVSPSGIETVLYSFGSVANGPAGDISSLVEGDDGNFYDVSGSGGASNLGTVFKITPEGILTLVHSFTGGSNDGSNPSGSPLLKGTDGNFYGVTVSNGPNDRGIVYKLTPAGVETIVYAFDPSFSGSHPQGALTEDSEGNLYGATQVGGILRTVCAVPGCNVPVWSGTIFEITTAGNAILLSDFGPIDADGTIPSGPPIFGQDGNLYGLTSAGGANDVGVLYEITG